MKIKGKPSGPGDSAMKAASQGKEKAPDKTYDTYTDNYGDKKESKIKLSDAGKERRESFQKKADPVILSQAGASKKYVVKRDLNYANNSGVSDPHTKLGKAKAAEYETKTQYTNVTGKPMDDNTYAMVEKRKAAGFDVKAEKSATYDTDKKVNFKVTKKK